MYGVPWPNRPCDNCGDLGKDHHLQIDGWRECQVPGCTIQYETGGEGPCLDYCKVENGKSVYGHRIGVTNA